MGDEKEEDPFRQLQSTPLTAHSFLTKFSSLHNAVHRLHVDHQHNHRRDWNAECTRRLAAAEELRKHDEQIICGKYYTRDVEIKEETPRTRPGQGTTTMTKTTKDKPAIHETQYHRWGTLLSTTSHPASLSRGPHKLQSPASQRPPR